MEKFGPYSCLLNMDEVNDIEAVYKEVVTKVGALILAENILLLAKVFHLKKNSLLGFLLLVICTFWQITLVQC